MTGSRHASDNEILEIIMMEEPGTLEEFPLVDDEGEIVAGLWFSGLPSWLSETEARRDFGIDLWDEVITTVSFWEEGPDSFVLNGLTYTLRTHQAPFGERECPLTGTNDGFQADGLCYYCDQSKEDGHGPLYLGEFGLNIYACPDEETI